MGPDLLDRKWRGLLHELNHLDKKLRYFHFSKRNHDFLFKITRRQNGEIQLIITWLAYNQLGFPHVHRVYFYGVPLSRDQLGHCVKLGRGRGRCWIVGYDSKTYFKMNFTCFEIGIQQNRNLKIIT